MDDPAQVPKSVNATSLFLSLDDQAGRHMGNAQGVRLRAYPLLKMDSQDSRA